MSNILICPDVHGRDFWKEPVRHIDEFDKVIFLGDYHDPYNFQVSKEKSRHMLRDELVPFILEHQDKCVCLLGNHDGNYLVGEMADRMDYSHREEIKKYLNQMNLQLIYRIDDVLFSHSGVLPGWLEAYELTLDQLDTLPFDDDSLLSVSAFRGGYGIGSCIWGDVREYTLSKHIPNLYQVFGHTQLEKEIIQKDFACLDCRKAFIMNTNTHEIKEYV